MSIANNIHHFHNLIPANVKLIAVSKTKPVETVQEAYEAGQRDFGENKAQDMAMKEGLLPKDIKWHFIGHLQTNKVKVIAPFVHLIHAVDSMKLLREINRQALANNRIIGCLLQFHIAEEETKFGLDLKEAIELLHSPELSKMNNIRIEGVMGMATFTDDKQQVIREFGQLRSIFEELKRSFFNNDDRFSELSMGMSDDFMEAIKEGSTMVRIGTSIFGARNYGS